MVMEYYEVVKKLIGPINPIGESHTDEGRFYNLTELVSLLDGLISDIEKVAQNETRTEYSMKKAGEFARSILDDWGMKRT